VGQVARCSAFLIHWNERKKKETRFSFRASVLETGSKDHVEYSSGRRPILTRTDTGVGSTDYRLTVSSRNYTHFVRVSVRVDLEMV